MAKIIIENNDNNSIPVRYTYDNIPIEIVKNIKNNLDIMNSLSMSKIFKINMEDLSNE